MVAARILTRFRTPPWNRIQWDILGHREAVDCIAQDICI